MLKILNSVCCARALCSQASTSTLPRAKRPTQHHAPSHRVPARADLHNLAGEAFHSLTSTTMTELLALAQYGVHMATAQQRLRSDCRHPPPFRQGPSLLTTRSSATLSIYSPRVWSLVTHTLLWCTSSANLTLRKAFSQFPVATGSLLVCLFRGTKESGWRGLHIIWQYFSTTTWTLPLKAGHVFSHALRHFTTWYQNSRQGRHMLPQEGLMSKQKEKGLKRPFRGLH